MKNIREFFMAICCALFSNVSAWIFFTFSYAGIFKSSEYGFGISGIIVLIVEALLFLLFDNKIIKKQKHNYKFFIIIFTLCWQAICWILFLTGLIFIPHQLSTIFLGHDCAGFLCGIEYMMFWLGMQITFVIMLIFKIGIAIYHKKKKITEQQ